MRTIENNCVQCWSVGLHCLGNSCPNVNVECIYCDFCGDEVSEDKVETYEGKDICIYCLEEIKEELEKDEE